MSQHAPTSALWRTALRHRHALWPLLLALGLFLVFDIAHPTHWRFAHAKADRSGVYDLGRARTLNRIMGHLRTHYVAPERLDPKAMALSALDAIQNHVPEIAFTRLDAQGNRLDPHQHDAVHAISLRVGGFSETYPLNGLDDLYKLTWFLGDLFQAMATNLSPQTDLESIEFAAISGLLRPLDPHTILMPPKAYREFQLSQRGRFGGIGITLGEIDDQLIIQDIMPGSPAALAGIHSGDRLVRVGDQSTLGLHLDQAVTLLRGEVGTQLTAWLDRPSAAWEAPRPFTLTRQEIKVPSVHVQALGNQLGWIHLASFQEETLTDLQAALAQLKQEDGPLRGLILDLRDNPGGLLKVATAVADLFLDSGVIVTTVRDAGKTREITHATAQETESRYPIVVLTNAGSASASEIVAGALKRNNRALVMGQRSFGKGSVQVLYRVQEAALKLTIAQYLTPQDLSIQGIGITPDIEILPIYLPTLPHTPGFDGRIDLNPSPTPLGGEAALFHALNSEAARTESSTFQLRLLDDHRAPTGHHHAPQRPLDTSLELARDLLLTHPSADRAQSLVQLAHFFAERQQKEDQRLEAALRPSRIDWRPCTTRRPKLEAQLIVPEQIEAGQTLQAELRLTNRSRQPVCRVHAKLNSGTPSLDGRSWVFGRLDPNQSATHTLSISLPAKLHMGGDLLRATLFQDTLPLDTEAEAPLTILSPKLPRLAYDLRIEDRPEHAPTISGNGDGLLQPGERVIAQVRITNLGPVDAEQVWAGLHNDSGQDLFMHTGRVELGTIPVGASVEARFDFEIPTQIQARLLSLHLELGDARNGGHDPMPLELGVFPLSLSPRLPAQGWAEIPAAGLDAHAAAHHRSAVLAHFQGGDRIAIQAEVGPWVEIALQGGHRAFLPERQLKRLDRKPSSLAQPIERPGHIPPEIYLDEVPLITDAPEIRIEGRVQFDGSRRRRRLLTAFNDNEKLFFLSPDSGDQSDRSSLHFDEKVHLHPGRNTLRFSASDGQNLKSHKHLVIYRTR